MLSFLFVAAVRGSVFFRGRFLMTSHVMQNTPNAQSLRIILFVVWATSDPAGNLREVE